MAGHAHDHDFHIPANNPWPPLSCVGAGIMAFGLIVLLHFSTVAGKWMLIGGGLLTLYSAVMWFYTLAQESAARGYKKVPLVLELANKYGMIFFIVSETMFFAGFFAAFFYLKGFNPVWPPENIETLHIALPTLNTLILLTSGVTITFAHHLMLAGQRELCQKFLKATIWLGIIFLCLQMYEYSHAMFSFSDGVYGSTFYMLTGFHGLHVFVGTVMLIVAQLRLTNGAFTPGHHFYFEAAAWYWHFVDVIWIGLFLFVYLM